ncbi:MAG: hypothetical protein R3E56_19930 [Burkholderiaceae bacterium]
MNRDAMKKLFRAVPLTLACGVLVAACGGGGSDTPADPIDPYVGTWEGACMDQGSNKWLRYTWSFAKVTASTASGALNAQQFGNADCEGKPLGGVSGAFPIVAIAGTTTASGKAAGKLALTGDNNKVTRYLFAAEGDVLYSSLGAKVDLDADGFPTGLKLDYPYTLKP